MSVYCCKRIFRYLLSPETFGYTLVDSGSNAAMTSVLVALNCRSLLSKEEWNTPVLK